MRSKNDHHSATEPFSKARASSLPADLDILLGDLCLHWGFCNSLTGAKLVTSPQPLTADAFARAVLVAEGFPAPELELRWHRQIRRAFVERYGETVSPNAYLQR